MHFELGVACAASTGSQELGLDPALHTSLGDLGQVTRILLALVAHLQNEGLGRWTSHSPSSGL